MNRATGMAMMVAGTVLVALGIAASDSVSSDLSQLFGGHPTSYSLWMLLGGLVLVFIGAGGWAASRSGPHRA